MKKFLLLIVATIFTLTACTSVTDNSIANSSSKKLNEDTVLWINSDGTDCDYGDWLENDKDCDKKKKKTYVDIKSSNKTSTKSSLFKSSNKKTSDKKSGTKKPPKKSPKRK